MITKPRVVKDYEKMDESVLDLLMKTYPMGYEKHLVKFQNREGKWVSALPFETEDKYYLIRMTVLEAQEIAIKKKEDEDDYEAIMANADIKDDYGIEEEE